MALDEGIAARGPRDVLGGQELHLIPRHECAVAQVVRHHDGRVQGGEIERRHGHLVVASLGVEDGGALVRDAAVRLLAAALLGHVRDQKPALLRLAKNLRQHLDGLASGQEEGEGHAGDPRHLDVVVHVHQLVQESLREVGILEAVHREAAAGLGGARLQLADRAVVHVLLLLSEKVSGHRVEGIGRELVVPLHSLEEIELHAALDGDLLAVPGAVRLGRERGVLHAELAADHAAPVREILNVEPFRSVDQVREIKIHDVVPDEQVRIRGSQKLTPRP